MGLGGEEVDARSKVQRVFYLGSTKEKLVTGIKVGTTVLATPTTDGAWSIGPSRIGESAIGRISIEVVVFRTVWSYLSRFSCFHETWAFSGCVV